MLQGRYGEEGDGWALSAQSHSVPVIHVLHNQAHLHCIASWAGPGTWQMFARYRLEWMNKYPLESAERSNWQLSDSEERTTESPSHFLSPSVLQAESEQSGEVAKSLNSSRSTDCSVAKRRSSGSRVGRGGREGRRKWNSHLTFEFSTANSNTQLKDHIARCFFFFFRTMKSISRLSAMSQPNPM